MCNVSAATINLNCNGIFTRGLPQKRKDFAHKRQVKHTFTAMQPFLAFQRVVKTVDSEGITKKLVLLIYLLNFKMYHQNCNLNF